MAEIVSARSPYIDAAFVPGEGSAFAVIDPSSEETVAQVEAASPAQVLQAIAAARRAFDTGPWPRRSVEERAEVLLRFMAALEARRKLLVETTIAEAGSTRMFAEMSQCGISLSTGPDLVKLARSLPTWEHNELPLSEYVVGDKLKLSIRQWEPVGVVAAITPSNAPLITNIWKVIPALAVGCTVVLRPSPDTPLEATVLGEAADEAGLPAGALNIVTEPGSEGAEVLTTHPDIDLVSFTGSSRVGRIIGGQAASGMKRLILELGGKSAQIWLPDRFENGPGPAVGGGSVIFYGHAGQGCSLQTRVLVPQEHKAAVVAGLAAAAAGMKIGDTRDAATTLGPVITAQSVERIEGLVADGLAAGGKLVAGGARPEDRDRGYYYQATVVDIDDNQNPLAQNEVFGPVVTVQGYRDLDEAVAIANDSPYDLAGGVYTGDLSAGLDVAARIRTGTVSVNTHAANAFTPMGGYKYSGVGRERGVLGIRAFQQAKHVVIGEPA